MTKGQADICYRIFITCYCGTLPGTEMKDLTDMINTIETIRGQNAATARKAWQKPELSQTRTSETAFGLGTRSDGKASIS